MAPDVFISYSHQEDPHWVVKFRQLLEREVNRRSKRKVLFWRDPQLLPGHDSQTEMLKGAASASVFVAVVSPGWLNSVACQAEFAAFQGVAVITALTLDVSESLPMALRRYQWEEFFSIDERGVSRTFIAHDRGDFKRAIESVATGIVRLLALPGRATLDRSLESARTHALPILRERCGKMRILDMERPIDSEAIYTRVNILERVTGRQRKSVAQLKAEFSVQDFGRFGMAEPKEKRVDAEELAASQRRLLVLGKPGAGKTTFLKRLAIRCLEGSFRGDLTPAYVELRSIVHSTIVSQLMHLWGVDPWPLIEAGRALILLDGLDELPETHFQAVRAEVDDLAERAGASLILLTSRIAAKEYVFLQFTEVEVADFAYEDIKEFARLWFLAKDMPEKAQSFVERLAYNQPILELAHNPLLLTMMCLLFEVRTDFDGNRAELYEEAIAVLLKKWDAKRSILRDKPYEQLTVARRQDLLCAIARERFERNEYLFETRSLSNQVRDYFSRYGSVDNLDAESVVKTIEAQHGLLVERANGIYSFSHLTFQEYFTARSFIAGFGDRWVELLPHILEPRWREVFLLVVSTVEPDEILIRMQWALDKLLCNELSVQKLFAWLKHRSLMARKGSGSAACRAFYWYVALLFSGPQGQQPPLRDRVGRNQAPDSEENPDSEPEDGPGPAINIGVELALDLDPAFEQLDPDYDLDLSLARAYHHATKEKHYWYGPRGYDRRQVSLNLAHVVGLAPTLSLPESFVVEIQWLWEEVDNNHTLDGPWIHRLRQAAIDYRDVGSFLLDIGTIQLLNRVYSGYRLVVNCMNTPRVTTAVRAYIEDNLLLPIAEIEKAPLPRGLNLSMP